MKIHVIDDNNDTTTMLQKFLSLKGHDCSVSNDGKHGLQVLQTKLFDVVLLDLAMPGFSGKDVLQNLSSNGRIKLVNIIAFTASSPSSEYEAELKSYGVAAILKKPVDPDELLDFLIRHTK